MILSVKKKPGNCMYIFYPEVYNKDSFSDGKLFMGPDSIISIATWYRLDVPGIECQ
jgi:hypothetical protein